MAYIPDTTVLQDRTLDLVREHDNVMLQLKQHAEAKKEERDKMFTDMMSIDAVNTINDRAMAKQMEMINNFNQEGVRIYKQYPNGNISVADKVKLMTMKRDLQQQQMKMAKTLENMDMAKKMLAQDYNGSRFDKDDSFKKIAEFTDSYTGTEEASISDFLEAAYVNFPDRWRQRQDEMFPDFSEETTKTNLPDGITRATSFYRRGGFSDNELPEKTLEVTKSDRELMRGLGKELNDPIFRQSAEKMSQAWIKEGMSPDDALILAGTELMMKNDVVGLFTRDKIVTAPTPVSYTGELKVKTVEGIPTNQTDVVSGKKIATYSFPAGHEPRVEVNSSLIKNKQMRESDLLNAKLMYVTKDNLVLKYNQRNAGKVDLPAIKKVEYQEGQDKEASKEGARAEYNMMFKITGMSVGRFDLELETREEIVNGKKVEKKYWIAKIPENTEMTVWTSLDDPRADEILDKARPFISNYNEIVDWVEKQQQKSEKDKTEEDEFSEYKRGK